MSKIAYLRVKKSRTLMFFSRSLKGFPVCPSRKCGAKWHKNTAEVKIFCKQEGSEACRISFCIRYLLQLWLDSLCFPLFIYHALSDVFKGLNIIPEYEERLPVRNIMMSWVSAWLTLTNLVAGYTSIFLLGKSSRVKENVWVHSTLLWLKYVC